MPVFSSRPLEAGPSDAELAASGVPDTSPTWELELLISGAVLFALFQIPTQLTAFFARLEPHATSTMMSVLLLGQLYMKAIVYALIASFVVHLVARAYWVGLVGLQSVFPKGVRWENFKSVPVTLDVYRTRLISLPEIIARTDNFCSMIFSFAFLLVLLFGFTIVVVSVYSSVAYLLSHLLLHGQHGETILLTLAVITAVVPVVTSQVDRRLGSRLGPAAQGVLRRVIIVTYRGTVQGVISPIFVPLLTNVGQKKVRAIFFVSLFGILAFVIAERFARQDQLSINSYDYFARSNRYGTDYRFYENQREGDDIYSRLPSIQSDIVTGPYVKLFIPYIPRRHNAAMAQRCPALRPIEGRGLQVGPDAPTADSLAVPALDCLARIDAVTLDGAPRTDLHFRFYEHPGSGMKGILAYIPIDQLSPGQHEITVNQVPALPLAPNASPLPPWEIPFWK